ncbi:MAG TPA: transcriptional repressor [Aquificaceae bacterium]|nr:transcriptional repressor [Aquificaceae bacterium]
MILMGINIEELKKEFTKFLKKKNMKITKSRLDMIDIIADYKKHFEIEELVNWISTRSDKKVSRSTVYRTVKLLEEFGAIKEVIKKNNKTIYEFVVGRSHHDHLVCTECGKIIEFVNEDIETLQDEICRQYGFKPIHHRLEIFGLCEECQKRI